MKHKFAKYLKDLVVERILMIQNTASVREICQAVLAAMSINRLSRSIIKMLTAHHSKFVQKVSKKYKTYSKIKSWSKKYVGTPRSL